MNHRKCLSVVPFLTLALASAAHADGGYPLDRLSRTTPATGDFACPDVELTTYSGTSIHYFQPVQVYVGFVEPLARFEEIARDTAVEIYGRAPIKLVHDGAYNCRRTRGYATLLSEHALGNALDVEGFAFGPAPAGTAAPEGLRGAFSVDLIHDWNATTGTRALHAKFLRLVAERVIDAEIFHVVLGPDYAGHKGHFHIDLAPYRLVDVFGFDPHHSNPPFASRAAAPPAVSL
jgi:hypothetical protein